MNIFGERKGASPAVLWKHTQIIETPHPGYSVNWHPNDIEKRQQLLRSICKVCQAVNKRWDTSQTEDDMDMVTLI
jgi:hypothetical protein